MRVLLLCPVAVIALALAACGDDAKAPKSSDPALPPTATTSRAGTADPPPADRSADAVKADNTGRNTRDRDDGATVTPFDQGSSTEDIAITTAVRRAVVAHKGLSVNAQNVKIIAKDGVVTLRGPVASDSERSAIVAIAQEVPEVKTVINKLEIAAP